MYEMLVEVLFTLLMVVKAVIVATVFAFIPAPRKSVRGEIVLITGAGSGLGQLLCLEFAKRGAVIVAWDINQKGNEETSYLVKEYGGKIHTYTCDVSNSDEVNKVADRVKQEVGNVSILVNNAGIVTGKKFWECSDVELQRTMAVNVNGHFWTLKNFLPAMMKHNHGHIVTIASLAGLVGVNGLTDYCASKFANVGFTESLALELMKENKDKIHTTTVCPYLIHTGMFHGFACRFPSLFPSLTPEYAARRIVTAVLTNQKLLIMPRTGYLIVFLKGLLPVDALSHLSKFAGVLDCMNEFTGRLKKQ